MNKESKPRNLKRSEKKIAVEAFIDLLKNITINGKPFVINATSKSITTNPDITIEEIQGTFNIEDKSKLDFIRQLYVRSGPKILKAEFPNENILNMPVLSFEENGIQIKLTY